MLVVRHRTVLHEQKRRRKDGWGLYAPDFEEHEGGPVVDKQLWLPPGSMEDLGHPDTITVTIEAGDKLNES